MKAIRKAAAGQRHIPPRWRRGSPNASRGSSCRRRARSPAAARRRPAQREIASALEITEGTVKLHVSSILGKLGAADRTEAVTRALQRGIVQLELAEPAICLSTYRVIPLQRVDGLRRAGLGFPRSSSAFALCVRQLGACAWPEDADDSDRGSRLPSTCIRRGSAPSRRAAAGAADERAGSWRRDRRRPSAATSRTPPAACCRARPSR